MARICYACWGPVFILSVEIFISEKPTDQQQPSIKQRLAQLDQHVAQHPGEPISGHLLNLFPEMNELAAHGFAVVQRNVPDKAPALWKTDKLRDESAPAFAMRVYAPWKGGICMADIGRFDHALYAALENYKAYHHGYPEGFDIPTLPELYSRWTQALHASGDTQISEKLANLRHLLRAVDRRTESGVVR